MRFYKYCSSPSAVLITVGKDNLILQTVLRALRDANAEPSHLRIFNALLDRSTEGIKIEWKTVTISRPIPFVPSTLSVADAKSWTETHRPDPSTELYTLNFSPVRPSLHPIEHDFKHLLTYLHSKGKIKGVPIFTYGRVFHFPLSTARDGKTSPNCQWHMDFLNRKEGRDVDDFFKYGQSNYVCSLGAEDGPRTLVLDVDRIEIPVLTLAGKQRSWILNAYIHALIMEGHVRFSALPTNTWVELDSRTIHRGPHPEDSFFRPAERAFLHLKYY